MVVLVFAVLVPIGIACGTSAVGVDQCDQIESLRCSLAYEHNCPNLLSLPAATGTSQSDLIASCQRFYSIQCLHGLAQTDANVPSTGQLNACIAEINKGSCEVILEPQTADACAWLIPPEGGTDASDGGSEAFTDVIPFDVFHDAIQDTKTDEVL